MPKGLYNRHPAELRKTCPDCGKSLHHMGYATHVKSHKNKKRKGKENQNLPVLVNARKVNAEIVAHELVDDSGRVSISLSFSNSALSELLRSIRIGGK